MPLPTPERIEKKAEDSDSDESIDQLEKLRFADVKPGMFVSGWEDPNDEVFEDKNPRGKRNSKQKVAFILIISC